MTRIPLRGSPRIVLCLVLAGCAGEEMAPYGRLTSLRVLAIQSDPVAPLPGETTTLTPLLYVPEGQGEPELEWSWCPFPGSASDGYPCELDSTGELAELAELGVPLELPPLELGEEPTASFTNSLDPLLLAGLCAGLDASGLEGSELSGLGLGFDCRHGFPVQVRLRARTDEDEVFAVRTLHLGFDPTRAPNAIPELEGLEAKVGGDWIAATDDDPGEVTRDEENELRALVGEDQAQSYELVGPDGETTLARERLTLSWFVESGDTWAARTGYIEGVAPIEVLQENRWFPALEDDYPEDTAELVLVLRDDREGVSWWRHTFDLVEAP